LNHFSASGPYPRPNLLPGRDPTLGLHHPSDVLARPFADQVRPFADQVRQFEKYANYHFYLNNILLNFSNRLHMNISKDK